MTTKILNLTQHVATPAQIADGVFEPNDKERVQRLLTFESIPSKWEMVCRAKQLVLVALNNKASTVMIGGAPYFMSILETVLQINDITPLYSFNTRDSIEVTDPITGITTKTAQFVHSGFVAAPPSMFINMHF